MYANKDPFGGHSFAFSNGRIKALEGTLLKESDFATIEDLADAKQALKFLKDKSYGNSSNSKDPEQLIENELNKTYKLIKEISPDKQLTDLFLLDIDAHNLKVCLKAHSFSCEDSESLLMYGGCFPVDLLKACVKFDDYSALGENFEKYLKDSSKVDDAQMLSTLVDKAVFSHIFTVLAKNKNKSLYNYFSKKAFFLNYNSKLRAKTLDYPSDKINDMMIELASDIKLDIKDNLTASEIEERMNQDLLYELRKEKHETFSIAPIVCFLIDKVNEAKRLRLIFSTLENK